MTFLVTILNEKGAVYSRLGARSSDDVARLVLAWADNVATRGYQLKLEHTRAEAIL